jgi:hypothetical protein
MPDGRMAALRPSRMAGRREESPGSTEARCRVTPGGGDPRESATENIPPSPCRPIPGIAWAARVKWCGKSAPRRRQRRWQGKPHREQDQVGAAGGVGLRRRRAGLFAAARVGRARRSATNVPDEWPSPPGDLPMGASRGGTEPGLQTVWRLAERGETLNPIFCACFHNSLLLISSSISSAHREGGARHGSLYLASVRSA